LQVEILGKSIPVESLDLEIAQRLKIQPIQAKEIALEIASKQFLIIDKFFQGAVSKYIEKLGATSAFFEKFVLEYKKKIATENLPESAEEEEIAEALVREEEPFDSGLGFEPTTPQADKRDIKRVFQTKVAHLLTSNDWAMKISVNILAIFYLGSEPNFAAELIRELSNNKEKLVSKGPVWKGKPQAPTVGNWLKYFLTNVQKEGKISPVALAQFFTADKELAKLPVDEKKGIENLAKLYEAIHNFAEDVNKKSLDQIYVFPFSEAEKKEAGKFLEKHADVETRPQARLDEGALVPFAGFQEKEYELIAQKTPEQILDYFESALTSSDKTKILAGLEVLVEKNMIPAVFEKNQNLQLIIQGYLKRHNLEADDSKKLNYFLRSVLEDRLQMSESEAARVGAHLADIFRENGQMEFAQLAYFDEQERAFKWV